MWEKPPKKAVPAVKTKEFQNMNLITFIKRKQDF